MLFSSQRYITACSSFALICACCYACTGSVSTDPSQGPDALPAKGDMTGGSNTPSASGSGSMSQTTKPSGSGSTSKPGSGSNPSMNPGSTTMDDPGATDINGNPVVQQPTMMHTDPPPADGPPGCGMDAAAFCDSFATASPGGRAGDLDDAEWSIGRISGISNWTQSQLEWWNTATTSACGAARSGIKPGEDFFACADTGRMVNAYNDGGGFTVQSMRPRRAFDFAGRTGIISFDVDGRSLVYLGHGIWWNFMLTEDPEPVPYQDGGSLQLFSRNGIGIEFQGGFRCDDYSSSLNSISMVFAERGYALTSRLNPDANCFKTGEGQMNHVEIHVSETSLEVFIADAGKPDTLRSMLKLDKSSAPNIFPLGFTRGYIHLQHSHYNAAKSQMQPSYASYQWDNVAFDGPSFAVPRSYIVPDSLTANREGYNTGYRLGDEGFTYKFTGVDVSDATRALLTFNTDMFEMGTKLSYRINGGSWHDRPFDFPPDQGTGARPIVLSVLDELVAGDNTIDIKSSNADTIAANIELTVDTGDSW